MIILYLIGILCSLVLFAPSIVPNFIKWPVALLVVLVIVFFFNLTKKDSIYVTHDTKKKLQNHGLFNPLIMYVSASSYVLGFTLISSHLKENNVTNFIEQFNDIVGLVKPEINNALFCGLILVIASIIIFYIRNGFKNSASESSLRFRAVWYTIFTVVSLLIGVFSLHSYANFDLYGYLATGYNLYIYLGLASLAVIIDLLVKLIIVSVRRSKQKKLENANKPIIVKPVKKTRKVTFISTFVKLLVTVGFFVGAMYLLDTYYPTYSEVATLEPMYFGIGFAACLYLLHLTDLLRNWIFFRSCNMKRSRFLLFVYDLLLLVGLAAFIIVVLVALISILGITEITIASTNIRLLYIAIAILIVQYLVIIITVYNKAKHRYLAALGGFLIFNDFVKEKKIKHTKKESSKKNKVKKVKAYKKPTILGVLLGILIIGVIYAVVFFGMKYLAPEFDFFGSYLGYLLIILLVYVLILVIFNKVIIYRASLGKTSKFLIWIHSLLLFVYLMFVAYALYHYLKAVVFEDNKLYLYILFGAFFLCFVVCTIGLINYSKKVRYNSLNLAPVVVEEPTEIKEESETSIITEEVSVPQEEVQLTKKEMKLAKKEAKKAKKLAKKNEKKAKIIEKERKRTEKQLAKKEAKINKNIAKVERKITKKLAKLEKKQNKNAPEEQGEE